MKSFLLALATVIAATGPLAGAQDTSSQTLASALEQFHVEDGMRAGGGPPLDRRITSSKFEATDEAFVAGYYFSDELTRDGALGPLRASLFDRGRRGWVHNVNVDDDVKKLNLMSGGSVLRVAVTPQLVLIETHASPSAGVTVVLDRSLKVLTSLLGFQPQVTTGGSIWYFGSMVHFADTHQETLQIFDARSQRTGTVYPPAKLPAAAETYRLQVKAAHLRLPPSGQEHEQDFDRSINSVLERDGTGLAALS